LVSLGARVGIKARLFVGGVQATVGVVTHVVCAGIAVGAQVVLRQVCAPLSFDALVNRTGHSIITRQWFAGADAVGAGIPDCAGQPIIAAAGMRRQFAFACQRIARVGRAHIVVITVFQVSGNANALHALVVHRAGVAIAAWSSGWSVLTPGGLVADIAGTRIPVVACGVIWGVKATCSIDAFVLRAFDAIITVLRNSLATPLCTNVVGRAGSLIVATVAVVVVHALPRGRDTRVVRADVAVVAVLGSTGGAGTVHARIGDSASVSIVTVSGQRQICAPARSRHALVRRAGIEIVAQGMVGFMNTSGSSVAAIVGAGDIVVAVNARLGNGLAGPAHTDAVVAGVRQGRAVLQGPADALAVGASVSQCARVTVVTSSALRLLEARAVHALPGIACVVQARAVLDGAGHALPPGATVPDGTCISVVAGPALRLLYAVAGNALSGHAIGGKVAAVLGSAQALPALAGISRGARVVVVALPALGRCHACSAGADSVVALVT